MKAGRSRQLPSRQGLGSSLNHRKLLKLHCRVNSHSVAYFFVAAINQFFSGEEVQEGQKCSLTYLITHEIFLVKIFLQHQKGIWKHLNEHICGL